MTSLRVWVTILLASCVSASAVELRYIEVRTGTTGLLAVPLTIINGSQVPLSCNADLAHWYSVELASVAPGESATLALWRDPQSGTVSALNGKDENMPIERLWCGFAGRAYATRAQIVLDAAAPAHRVTCTAPAATGPMTCQ